MAPPTFVCLKENALCLTRKGEHANVCSWKYFEVLKRRLVFSHPAEAADRGRSRRPICLAIVQIYLEQGEDIDRLLVQ